MTNEKVLIAGGGIGGLTLALTLHQIGVPFLVIESSSEMRPLGVGINVQPNAVRELFDLGIEANLLDRVGLPAKEWALVGLNGREVYAEARGLDAGYKWPQYAAHRGKLHMLLYQILVERAGKESVVLGAKVESYSRSHQDGIVVSVRYSDGSKGNFQENCSLVQMESILRCERKCTQISRQYIGVEQSCGAARLGRSRCVRSRPLLVWARTNIGW